MLLKVIRPAVPPTPSDVDSLSDGYVWLRWWRMLGWYIIVDVIFYSDWASILIEVRYLGWFDGFDLGWFDYHKAWRMKSKANFVWRQVEILLLLAWFWLVVWQQVLKVLLAKWTPFMSGARMLNGVLPPFKRRSYRRCTGVVPPFYRWCELPFAKVSSYILMYRT